MAIERFTWATEKGAEGDITQRVRSKQFGDGYEQSVDQQHTKELSDAQRDQARLRDRLATSDLRLSVLLEDPAGGCNVRAAPGAVGVVHATRRAQLDPAHAQRIIGITDAGDQGLIALRACQAYAKEVSGLR